MTPKVGDRIRLKMTEQEIEKNARIIYVNKKRRWFTAETSGNYVNSLTRKRDKYRESFHY